jgi:protein-tyrosine phosphatase
VYLAGRRPPATGWDQRWVRWPDFRLPTDADGAVETLTEAFARAATERVELACGGGIGRTGTALALVATFAGVPPGDAVTWVRAAYHPRAVEMPWQRRWVERTAAAGRA